MSRATVRKVFLTGLVVSVVGGVLLLLNLKADHATAGYQAGVLLVGIGVLIQFVSWLLALVASAMLGRWGWFVVTLIFGLIGLLLVVMIVYSLVGPTRSREARQRMAPA